MQTNWRDWIVDNLRRSRGVADIVNEMSGLHFEPTLASAVVAKIARELSQSNTASVNDGFAPSEPFDRFPDGWETGERKISPVAESLPRPSISAGRTSLTLGNQNIDVLMRLQKPDIVLLGNVLSSDECDQVIRVSIDKLDRSTVADEQTGQTVVSEWRTSYGFRLALQQDDFIETIDRRLAQLANWPVERCEGLQVLRYAPGAEFRPHYDFYHADAPGNAVFLANGGQRVATLILYLNDVVEGGETVFPRIGLSIVPRRGQAVFFSYFDPQKPLDPWTLHGGAPVHSGEKWIATKWFRESSTI